MEWNVTDGTKESLPQKDCWMVVGIDKNEILYGYYTAKEHRFSHEYITYDSDCEVYELNMTEKDILYIAIPDFPV
jgi:hypothetical protein